MNWRFNSRRLLAIVTILCGIVVVENSDAGQPASGPAVRRDSAAADCNDAGVSADGRFVVFVSSADNLVTGDHNGLSDVFVRDRTLGRTILVSANSSGTASGNGASRAATISADGRFVAFESLASDLVPDDTNGVSDIFFRDLVAGTTTMVSVSNDGITPGNSPSSWPVMTPDGQFVLFESRASNLDTNDVNNAADLFVRDMSSGVTTLVTRDRFSNASALGGEFYFSDAAQISDDGRWVAFSSAATNLVANDKNSTRDVFLRDLLNRTNILISVNTNKVTGNNISGSPVMSPDGRFVAFQSVAGDLVANDNNRTNDVFLRDVLLGTTSLVSVNRSGASGAGSSSRPVMSRDGSYVGFQSLASDLVTSDSGSDPNIQPLDVFVRDLQTGVTTMISEHSSQTVLTTSYYTNWTGPGGEARALPMTMSGDGRLVVFQSLGADETIIISNITSLGVTVLVNQLGTYVFDQTTGERTRIPSSVFPALSSDGSIIAFQSAARDQLANDPGTIVNIFARDRNTGATELISRRDPGLDSAGGNGLSQLTRSSFSADGRFLAYESFAPDLVGDDTNATSDVFVRDLIVGTNERVGRNSDMTQSYRSGARLPAISGDGRRVAFEAVSVTNGLNNQFSLVIYDRSTRTNQFISFVSPAGKPGSPATPVWSADARFLAFQSSWVDPVVAASTTGQIYYRDLEQDTNVLVTFNPAGAVVGDRPSWNPLVNANGDRVLYLSSATDLVTNVAYVSQSGTNLFLWDAATQSNALISVAADGSGLGRVSQPAITPDGRFAAFLNTSNLYFADLTIASLTLAATNAASASLSADGRFIAFETTSSLAANDGNGTSDIYVLDQSSNTVALVSVNADGTGAGNGKSTAPLITPDGRYVVFTSQASDLVANDNNGFTDVFLRDLTAGTTLLLSANFTGTGSGNKLSGNPVLSADGRTIAFESYSSDLGVGDFNSTKDLFVFHLGAGDSDGDGMADDWEIAYFGDLSRDGTGDFDGDGQTDLQEFLAGTNPTDNNSIFRAFALSNSTPGGGTMVLWNAVVGRTYQVQYKDGAADPDWKEIVGDVLATSSTSSKLDDSAQIGANRFYRVKALP